MGFLSSSVKLHYYGRRTISGKLLVFGFVATMRLLSNYFDLLCGIMRRHSARSHYIGVVGITRTRIVFPRNQNELQSCGFTAANRTFKSTHRRYGLSQPHAQTDLVADTARDLYITSAILITISTFAGSMRTERRRKRERTKRRSRSTYGAKERSPSPLLISTVNVGCTRRR